MTVRTSLLLLACAGTLLLPSPVAAQTAPAARRSVAAIRLTDTQTVTLDGRLDEPFWSSAAPATDVVQVDPANGSPATEQTEMRIAYNSHALFMGVTCLDSEPEKWIGYQRRRDEFLSSDDRFMWTIDTFMDARSGYFFEMNPSGMMGDSTMGGGIDNRQWDGIWNARVTRSEIGWTIEIMIPFRSLNFDPNNDEWGINFQRTVRRKNEDSIWMGWARNQGLRRMANAGVVTGIRNVTQGLGLDVKPYALAVAESSPGRGTSGFSKSAERRDFLLDGAPFFAFGSPVNGDLIVNPFFSRRIGLTPGGTPQTINYGAKVTGQMGRQDVGFLHVRTGEDNGTIGEEFTVDRVRRRILSQSSFGGIYTRRDPHGDQSSMRQTAGVDVRLATARFMGSQNLEGTGYRRYQPSVEYGSRPRGSRLVRRYLFSAGLDVQTDTPSRGITLPFGAQYDTNVLSLRASTANRRTLALSTTVEAGGFYSGTKRVHQPHAPRQTRPRGVEGALHPSLLEAPCRSTTTSPWAAPACASARSASEP